MALSAKIEFKGIGLKADNQQGLHGAINAPDFGNRKIIRKLMWVKPILSRNAINAPLVALHCSELTTSCHERRAKTWGAFEAKR